jgi:hypothetical protein
MNVTDPVWETGDIVAFIEAARVTAKKRVPYRKRKI